MVSTCYACPRLLFTVPACAVTEAWHPTVSGTGSSSSSAGWTPTSAPSPPGKHTVIVDLMLPLDNRGERAGRFSANDH